MPMIRATSGIIASLLFALATFAQSSSTGGAPGPATQASDSSTIRGCLEGQRGNYIVVEKTGMVFALKGVGNKLDGQLNREVEVKGKMLPGTIKTGVRPEKAGSSPSDTLHGIDGTPFQVTNPQTDVRTVAKHCKAADSE